ncbi:MAG: hypothetical protein A3G25_12605 [Betaproteobacteria bacterium RIFCSPLOWO2_12_FULL_63_13]|nr:MAG: hypothetical protein A3H32_08340 [Betaproteobacteria bacterium RIFCSPLOWO2_02_FULL_63_19]OGA53589.1 MAG: hypothetical protein A3G25_12605 [Betaproteobacteria bacterium RIFCSPLOWO2_12_FULL_63_13]
MKRGQIVFPSLILAFTAVMLSLGYFHYQYSWTAFAFPFGAGLAVCILCAVEIANSVRGRGNRAPRASELPPVSLTGVAWLFALAVFLYAFGFVFGAALYLLVALRGNGFSWRLSVGTAVVALLVTWGIFIKVLGVQLPIVPLWID